MTEYIAKSLRIISLLVFTMSSGTILGQNMVCDNPIVDLGQVRFNHLATATYILKNRSNHSIKIENVDTGCGCTTLNYSAGHIEYGGETTLNINFDAKQLGHFQRTIYVYENTSNIPIELTLKGNVVMNVENFSGIYPVSIGRLLADQNVLEFDDVNKGDVLSQEIHIMNPSGQYVEPVVMHTPSYISVELTPSRLAPKATGILRFTLDSNKLRSYGLNQTQVYLATSKGEKVSEDKEITISTVLLPPLIKNSNIDDEDKPHINLSSTIVDMSDFEGKTKKKAEILLTNSGRSTLEISSIQMFTQGLEVTLPKRQIAPGKSVKLKITGIASQLRNVKTRPRIIMITNDEYHQKVVIEIKN